MHDSYLCFFYDSLRNIKAKLSNLQQSYIIRQKIILTAHLCYQSKLIFFSSLNQL